METCQEKAVSDIDRINEGLCGLNEEFAVSNLRLKKVCDKLWGEKAEIASEKPDKELPNGALWLTKNHVDKYEKNIRNLINLVDAIERL